MKCHRLVKGLPDMFSLFVVAMYATSVCSEIRLHPPIEEHRLDEYDASRRMSMVAHHCVQSHNSVKEELVHTLKKG